MGRRRKKGIFDPDYRRKEWRDTAFAPQNSAVSITDLSVAIGAVAGVLTYLLLPGHLFDSAVGWGVVLGIGGSATFQSAMFIRNRTRRRLTDDHQETYFHKPSTQESTTTSTSIPRANTPPTREQALKRAYAVTGVLLGAALYFYAPDFWKLSAMLTTLVILVVVALSYRLAQYTLRNARTPEQDELESESVTREAIQFPVAQTYQDFEHEVAHLFNTLTSYKAVVVGGARDGGIDIRLYDGARLIGIAQCKHYAEGKALPPAFIRELYAAKTRARVESAFLVTTASFTRMSKREALAHGIKLIDGDKLNHMRQSVKEKRRAQASRLPDARQSFSL